MRIVGHLDMDAFFAAIEERDNPRFRGKPIAVGSDPLEGKGRGVVSTANYKAREYGIFSATPISKAWQLSEKAKAEGKTPVFFVDVNFYKYEKASDNIIKIIKKYSSLIERASIDEAYFDLSFAGSFERAGEICRKIKEEIRRKEKLTASIGVGPNKLIAKIASDFKKPDGLTIVKKEDTENFLEPMSVRKIPGIGPKAEIILRRKDVRTIKDLKKIKKEELAEEFGKWGGEMYQKARGIDDSLIEEFHEIKSIGEQATFSEDTLDSGIIFKEMEYLCKNVFRRFSLTDFDEFKTIVVTVRFSDFETKTKSYTPEKRINSLTDLKFEVLKIITPFLDRRMNPDKKKIRLLGVRVEKLFKKQTLNI